MVMARMPFSRGCSLLSLPYNVGGNTANAELELRAESTIRIIACEVAVAKSIHIREAAHIDGILQAMPKQVTKMEGFQSLHTVIEPARAILAYKSCRACG
jgi:hypothetical protein